MMKLGRSRAILPVAVVAGLLLTGCASGGGKAPAETAAEAPGTFPQTVSTAFGDVTIDAAPQRVVALGWSDAETALALGVQPVGASDWIEAGGDEGVGPWAAGLYDQAPELIETLEPSYEMIAALEPDLILDVKGSGDPDRYERLSEIATTVGVPEGGESYLTTVEEQVGTIATALGVPERGDELLAEVDAAFDTVAKEHPDWQGRTVSSVAKTSEGWGAYLEGGGRLELLNRLGFEQNPEIAAAPANSGGFSVDVSGENLGLIDADLIVASPIYLDTTAITDDPQWKQLPAVEDGRAIVFEGEVAKAFSANSPLASIYVAEQLTPMIEDALPAD